MNTLIIRALAVLMLVGLTHQCLGADLPAREDLGRSVKLTILVDKVMQPEEGWVTKEWIVKETADAGFNVFSPRSGYDRLEEVREVTGWCEKHGLYHMPWMRGTLEAPKDETSEGKRMVWEGGNEQSLYSPNADEFWEWTTKYIVEYAKISAEMPNLMGVFLDYENYSRGGSGNCYRLSYDDVIMGKFAEARGVDLPVLELKERKGWLEEQGLHEAFSEFQINHWRERCRTLREAVDRHNPAFQFCIYPAPGTMFMLEACYPEWATDAAPLILADPWTYGRPSRFLPQAEALQGNLEKLERGMAIAEESGINYIYSGGIDPVVRGADPEFSGKNAVMISEITDGYWIFYEGPKYNEDHPEYFKWFTWANKAIAADNLKAWHEPRETPENWDIGVFDNLGDGPKLIPPEVTGETVEFPPMKLRGGNLMFLAVEANKPVEIVLRSHTLADYKSLLAWDIRDRNMEQLASGMIPHDAEGAVTFTPETSGVYLLGADAGSCPYSIVSANVPVGLYAGEKLGVIFGAERLYFQVPEGVEEFTLSAKGSAGEPVRINVFDPEGDQVATGQTTLSELSVKVTVPAGDHVGKTWALQIARADEGVLEDNAITLDAPLPPILSLTPEHIFGVSP